MRPTLRNIKAPNKKIASNEENLKNSNRLEIRKNKSFLLLNFHPVD